MYMWLLLNKYERVTCIMQPEPYMSHFMNSWKITNESIVQFNTTKRTLTPDMPDRYLEITTYLHGQREQTSWTNLLQSRIISMLNNTIIQLYCEKVCNFKRIRLTCLHNLGEYCNKVAFGVNGRAIKLLVDLFCIIRDLTAVVTIRGQYQLSVIRLA